jgi:hypothetical protein
MKDTTSKGPAADFTVLVKSVPIHKRENLINDISCLYTGK